MLHRILTPALLLASLGWAQQCSLDTVRGSWASTVQATFMITDPSTSQVVPTPAAILNVGAIDYGGHFTGTTNGLLGGQTMAGTYAGTMQVNPDCTGSVAFTLTFPGMPPMTGAERLVVKPNGTEIWAMPSAALGALGGATGIEHFRRIAWEYPQCTQDMVRGVYTTTFQGTWLGVLPGQSQPAAFPYSQIGVAAFDSGGNGAGAASMSAGGTVMDLTLPSVAITVHSDCTGTIVWKGGLKSAPMAFTGTVLIVVLDNGDNLLELQTQTNSGPLIGIGTATRLSSMPLMPHW